MCVFACVDVGLVCVPAALTVVGGVMLALLASTVRFGRSFVRGRIGRWMKRNKFDG